MATPLVKKGRNDSLKHVLGRIGKYNLSQREDMFVIQLQQFVFVPSHCLNPVYTSDKLEHGHG